MSTKRQSLAIGIDAAESTLVREMIQQGELPALRALLDTGKWLDVCSPSTIGSGAVWPTFLTREEPTAHGIYSEWQWLPEPMTLRRYEGHHLTPFWKELAERGVSVGVFDVPFAPPVGVTEGFEVCEWWAHDSTAAGLGAGPEPILSLVKEWPAHPLSLNRFFTSTPNSNSSLQELATACCDGARLRGQLAQQLIGETNPQVTLVVFPEIHHAGHQLWHTVAGKHHFYNGLESNGAKFLRDVYRAVDEQIGVLIASVPSASTVMVFALHGMRPTRGFPVFLSSILCERGYSSLASWRSQSWKKRALSLFAAAKRHSPAALKKLYYQLTPITTTYKLARPTMLPSFDWQNTRAFSLPTDQYGWIRINLIGRESRGIVPLDQYDSLCSELEQMLLSLTSTEGDLLVQVVTRTTANTASPLVNPLPDLVVHWRDAAFSPSLKIKGSNVAQQLVSMKSTGQHKAPGFCIYRGPHRPDGTVDATDLSRLIADGSYESC